MPKGPTFPFRTSDNIEPFDAYGSVSILAGAETQLCIYAAPTQIRRGFITLFGHGIDDISAWPTTIFRIERQRTSVRDYGDIRDQLGEFSDPKEIGPVLFKAGDSVRVMCVNNDAVAHLFAARLRGFVEY